MSPADQFVVDVVAAYNTEMRRSELIQNDDGKGHIVYEEGEEPFVDVTPETFFGQSGYDRMFEAFHGEGATPHQAAMAFIEYQVGPSYSAYKLVQSGAPLDEFAHRAIAAERLEEHSLSSTPRTRLNAAGAHALISYIGTFHGRAAAPVRIPGSDRYLVLLWLTPEDLAANIAGTSRSEPTVVWDAEQADRLIASRPLRVEDPKPYRRLADGSLTPIA
jgi:hypothetical protein